MLERPTKDSWQGLQGDDRPECGGLRGQHISKVGLM